MKHLVGVSAFVLMAMLATDSLAGHRRGSCGGSEACGSCGSSCGTSAPCATVVQAAPQPQYVERQVTRYKCVQKEQVIQEVVCRLVPRQETYNYTVMVPVTTQETRKQTCYKPITKQVEYMCTVLVPVTTNEKRTVTVCNLVEKQVDVRCTVMVPKTVQEKRTVAYCEIQRQVREFTVPVCRTVQVQCQDQCGNCYTSCKPVVEYTKVQREVCVPVSRTKEVLVNVTICEAQERIVKRTICVPVTTTREIVVPVTHCEQQQRKMTRLVCEMVPETRDVVVNLVTCKAEQRTGTRTVYETARETVSRKILVNEMVPYTTTERVAVCNVGCNDGCTTCYSHGRRCRH